MEWLKRRWFLVGLLVLIPAGLAIGSQVAPESLQGAITLAESGGTAWLVAAILFLMSFSLDSRQIGRSLRSPGPVLFACLINFGVTPLIAWPLMSVQQLPDYAIGLMIAATVPCTMAAASVWTRRAGGNDAVSLLVTLLTNGLCFLVTPLWLNLFATTEIAFDVTGMMWRLVYTALLPATAGQFARLIPRLRQFATAHKPGVGVVAQSFILVIVFSAALLKMGPQLPQMTSSSAGLSGLFVVWLSCVIVHVAALAVGWHGGRLLGFNRSDRIAIAFAGSQKTLPIGLLVATHPTMFGDGSLPFALFPMLLYHASQLFLDTAIADRWRLSGESPRVMLPPDSSVR